MAEQLENINVTCPHCWTGMIVPAETEGKKVRCNECQQVFTAKATVVHSVTDDDYPDALHQKDKNPSVCPSCGKDMSPIANLCVQCGYNRKTGQSVRGAARHQTGKIKGVKSSNKGSSAPRTRSAPSGSFILGIFLSFLGAGFGGVIWVVVLAATGYEVGYIAWALGALAGAGMLKGYGGKSTKGGVVAAFMAVGSIFIVKGILMLVIVGTNVGNRILEEAEKQQTTANMNDILTDFVMNLKISEFCLTERVSPQSSQTRSYINSERPKVHQLNDDQKISEIERLTNYDINYRWNDEQGAKNGMLDSLIMRDFYSKYPYEIHNKIYKLEELSDSEWNEFYTGKQDIVDNMNPNDYFLKANEIIVKYNVNIVDKELGKATEGVWDVFGALDLLWIALALGSAYGIAAVEND